jgi:hypothetical protein
MESFCFAVRTGSLYKTDYVSFLRVKAFVVASFEEECDCLKAVL